jgi:carbonic anhydrase/acetyltransferase-like protein (isoleucine patch superfamily)
VKTLSLVGHGAQVGSGTVVKGSVIGNRCVIGSDCIIKDSYIFEGAQIEDGSAIRNSVIGAGAKIGSRSDLSSGTLVGPGAVVGRGARLRGERVSSEEWNGRSSDPSSVLRELSRGTRDFRYSLTQGAQSWEKVRKRSSGHRRRKRERKRKRTKTKRRTAGIWRFRNWVSDFLPKSAGHHELMANNNDRR